MLNDVKEIAVAAGKKILEVYHSPDFDIQLKSDQSPVTKADKLANDYIVERLQEKYPEIGVLAEESKDSTDRLSRERVWIIDPLDGTKEFIKRNGEYTVNIGLAVNKKPFLGVVFVPAKNELYYAVKGMGAFFQGADGPAEPIHVSSKNEIEKMSLIKSRSHASEKLTALLDKYHFASVKESGSSIKICRIARGEAEVYYRFGPTNEWDICAAHCVINEAGGEMTALDGSILNYNKPNPLNHGGFAVSNRTIHWRLIEMAAEFSTAQ